MGHLVMGQGEWERLLRRSPSQNEQQSNTQVGEQRRVPFEAGGKE